MPAPISPNVAACSSTSQSKPFCDNASAAARPPMPPPAIRTRLAISTSSCAMRQNSRRHGFRPRSTPLVGEIAMKMLAPALRFLCAAVMLAAVDGASAQAPVQNALIAEFTGPFADYGPQIYNGIKAYL